MREIILSELSTIIKNISGLNTAQIDADTDLIMLGLDSLVIVRIGQNIEKRFGIELKISQFYEETSSLNKLADYLVQHLPKDWKRYGEEPRNGKSQESEVRSQKPEVEDLRGIQNPVGLITVSNVGLRSANPTYIENIMIQQMQAMSQLMTHQLDVLKTHSQKGAFNKLKSSENASILKAVLKRNNGTA